MLQTATGVMTLVLVAICAMYAVQARQREQQARRIPVIVDISNDLSVAAQNFRLERGAGHPRRRRHPCAHAGAEGRRPEHPCRQRPVMARDRHRPLDHSRLSPDAGGQAPRAAACPPNTMPTGAGSRVGRP